VEINKLPPAISNHLHIQVILLLQSRNNMSHTILNVLITLKIIIMRCWWW